MFQLFRTKKRRRALQKRWWGNWGKRQESGIRNKELGRRRARKLHHELMTGAGIAGITALSVLILFILVWYGAGALRRFIEEGIFSNLFTHLQELENKTPVSLNTKESTSSTAPYTPTLPPVVPVPPSVPSLPSTQTNPNVLYSTFYAGFSGTGWLNTDQTSLYRDDNESAILLPPRFKLMTYEVVNLEIEQARERACISGRCLSHNGLQLTFDNTPLRLPDAVQNKSVAHVSIAALDSKWAVGIVTKDGNYIGWAFVFDGKNFEQVFGGNSSPISSKYDGVLGFGGTDNDWLAVYGAYDGLAVRVSAGKSGLPGEAGLPVIESISNFFPIRVMNGGFMPGVIRYQLPQPNETDRINWYIYSLTDKSSKLVKLWDNGTGTIQGGADLTGSVLPQDTATALLAPAPPDGGRPSLFIKATKRDGSVSYLKFIDEGFDTSAPRMVVSSNINSYPWSVARAAITSASMGRGGGAVAFALSPDGTTWRDAPVGQMIELDDASSTKLYWRGVFTPSRDPMFSPFLPMVKIEYQINRPNQ